MKIDFSIRELFFVGMAAVEQLQRALEQLLYIFFGSLMGRKKFVQVKIREAPVGYSAREQLPQSARFNAAEIADFLENDSLQRVVKNRRIEQAANLRARSALQQNGAQQPQGIALELRIIL